MERMKAETVVDLFQFIKATRLQRAGLVANKVHSNNTLTMYVCCAYCHVQEQYEFCHQVLADFLDGFETYANFKEII